MKLRVGLFGFGRSVEMIFFDSKEARREKVIRRSYKLKNRFAPEFLAVADEEADVDDPSHAEGLVQEVGQTGT
jgi:hypothetical protein